MLRVHQIYTGLFLLPCTQTIFPLQPVRSNFARLQEALAELGLLAQDLIFSRGSSGCLLEGLQEVLGEFRRVVQNLKQQVHVHVCTCLCTSVYNKFMALHIHVQKYSYLHTACKHKLILHVCIKCTPICTCMHVRIFKCVLI